MKKRWLAAFLTLLMCLSLLPLTATATEEESTLFMRYAMTDSNGKFTVSTRAPMDTYSLPCGYNATVIFYYGSEDNVQMVHMDDLALENLSLQPRPLERLASADLYGYVIRLYAGEAGTGTVTYKPTGATFMVNTTPDIELFATTNFENESLNSLQFEENDTELTGVLKATDGWTILGTEATSKLPAPDFVIVTPVDGQEYAAISVDMTHSEFAPGSYEFILRVSGTPYGSDTPETLQVTFELIIEEAYSYPALYSQPVLSEEYLLGDEISYTGTPLEFYVLWDNLNVNGFGNAEGVDLAGEPEEFEIYNEDDELVGFKLKVENPQMEVYCFELQISGEWEFFEFNVVDNRPLLRCRALTYNGVNYSLNEDDILRTIVSGKADETVGYVFYEVCGDHETKLPLNALTFPALVTPVALNEDETWIALTFKDGSGEVSYTADGVTLTLPVVVSDSETDAWGETPVQTFDYNGETLKIGLAGTGFLYEDVPQIGLHDDHQTVTGVSQDEISWEQYVMAVMDTKGNFIADLSANIQITDAAITEFYSLGGSCSLEVSEELVEYEGTPLKTIKLTTQGAFIAEISVSYELIGATPYGPLEISGIADFRLRSLPRGEYSLDLSTADTAAELNDLFSSPESLVAWMETNAPKDYELYTILESMGDMGMSHFDLYLPAVTYDDIIVVQLEDTMLNIYGATDRNGDPLTVMPGLHLKDKSPACNLIGIHFKHNPEKELVYEELSCGVLACGDADTLGDGNAIEDCVIEGFDCAVRNTKYGHIGLGINNLVCDCTYGLYMDCAGKTRGSVYTDISRSTFVDCQVGIYIKSLPDYMDAFEYRVYYCDFIDVDTDFHVENEGKFYFYRNFYGSVKSGKTFDEVEVITDFLTRTPTVAVGESTTAITNPRFVLSCAWFELFGDDNFLSLDSNRETIILNKEADDLVMDTDELSKEVDSADQAVMIGVADENEDVQATWTIN